MSFSRKHNLVSRYIAITSNLVIKKSSEDWSMVSSFNEYYDAT